MQVLGYTEFRQNLAKSLDYVQENHAPILIKRGKSTAVLISLEDYNALNETEYLLASKANAEHLKRGMEAVKNAQLTTRALLDD